MRDESSTVATAEKLEARSRDVDWYDEEKPHVPDSFRQVLEQYSKLPPEKVGDHVYQIRERAWDVWPYPCIGGWRFMDLNLCTMPQYSEVVQRVQKGGTLLDMGCCFGQEMRRLILDGAPSQNLTGLDLRQDFFDLGYDLFLDRDRCDSTFIAADMFKPCPELDAREGMLSVVYAGAFFHLFDRPQQIYLAQRVVRLLSPEPGVMLLGRQVGNIRPGRFEHATNDGGWMFRHNEASWKELWDEVGAETGSKWDVKVELGMAARFQKNGASAEGARQMYFCVTRL